jgi:ADP-ribosyl-[dinitrogen reductase] hydrolase
VTSLRDRYAGCLLGLAVGDAVGTTVEFQPRGAFEPVTDMIGGGPFGLKAGQWTDDTSMALCLAESLLARRGFDARDQMGRYLNWWKWGYLSSTGTCFDIGATVLSALERFESSGEPYCGSLDPETAGNGSLMRLAPVALFYGRNIDEVVRFSAQSSRTTHGAPEAVEYLPHLLLFEVLDHDVSCANTAATANIVRAIHSHPRQAVPGGALDSGAGSGAEATERSWCGLSRWV